jgi:hypothetical protein
VIWGEENILTLCKKIILDFLDFLGFAGCLATSDLHCMGVICFVLASPPTTGSMCSIFGVLWALLSFLWSFIDPGTWVKTANHP